MGAIKDMRKVLQGCVAPELRAITARLDAIDGRLAAQDKVLNAWEKAGEARHSEMLVRIESLKASFEVDKRLEKLETGRASRA